MPERKINLVYAAYDLKVGGAQDLVKTLALNADKDRYDVSVVTIGFHRDAPDEEPLVSEIRDAGVEVANFRMWGWEHKEERERLITFMRQKKVDVVHSHLFPVDDWVSRAAKAAGVPAVLYSKHETYKKKKLRQRYENALVHNMYADMVLATSRLTRDHLIFYEFIMPWKIRIIPNPVDTEYFSAGNFSEAGVRDELGIPSGASVVGNMCRLVGRKGVESFVEACRYIEDKVPGCYFIMVGEGYRMEKLKAMVSSGGPKNFIFTGTRRDIGELMSAMDVFLFTPYWGEAFPLVMLEAMSMQKAIVASNVCSNNELIENGVSGYLPSPKLWRKGVTGLDAARLGEAAVELLGDPGKRSEFGRRAREYVVERFGVRAVMSQLDEVYREILGKKGAI